MPWWWSIYFTLSEYLELAQTNHGDSFFSMAMHPTSMSLSSLNVLKITFTFNISLPTKLMPSNHSMLGFSDNENINRTRRSRRQSVNMTSSILIGLFCVTLRHSGRKCSSNIPSLIHFEILVCGQLSLKMAWGWGKSTVEGIKKKAWRNTNFGEWMHERRKNEQQVRLSVGLDNITYVT